MALWYRMFPDGDVRFAKAVATPYLLHCNGGSATALAVTLRHRWVVPHTICCIVALWYGFQPEGLRFFDTGIALDSLWAY